MIVLLCNCSYSWCQSDTLHTTSSTGEVNIRDSVLIAIDDIKIANAKMIELKYEKQINSNLREIIRTDSVLIDAMRINLDACTIKYNNDIIKVKKQRNASIVAGGSINVLLLLLLILVV